jgi:hypothetical protein
MATSSKVIRIEPAFDDLRFVREMFERHAPYRTIAAYIPRKPEQAAVPYFRGNWAVGGEPLVDGAETILHTIGLSMGRGQYLTAQGSVPRSSW